MENLIGIVNKAINDFHMINNKKEIWKLKQSFAGQVRRSIINKQKKRNQLDFLEVNN